VYGRSTAAPHVRTIIPVQVTHAESAEIYPPENFLRFDNKSLRQIAILSYSSFIEFCVQAPSGAFFISTHSLLLSRSQALPQVVYFEPLPDS
jgi:hypothetical protein